MPGWQPFNDNHAIDVMAAVVSFAQPVPDLTLKKILKAAEDVAFPAGLRSRHRSHSMVVVDPQGVSAIPPNVSGFIFNASSEGDDALPGRRVAEQLQVDTNSVVYRIWRYVSWSWQIERMHLLMAPAIKVAQSVTAIGSVRLEYLDRFWFDGDPADAIISSLLRRDCPYLASHIFERKDLWHVHTGAFLATNPIKRLQQVLVDALDAPALGNLTEEIKRWIHITTALEDRFAMDGENDPRDNPDFPFNSFDTMHVELKNLLSTIITAESANRIYLTGRASS